MENFGRLETHLFLNEINVNERLFSGMSSIKPLCEAWASAYMSGSNEDLTLNLDMETMDQAEAYESVASEILTDLRKK